ncbi:ABC transporter ATP-binding protein [Chryseobacterium contaminans]|uniref:ABC transporter ATP-binding protein n=1 Tax=Chryseobacterium contaminans TaxID=1423959 RepID=A0A1M6VNF4_9FLAO|nr:peptidase domain-containing ABC transporter [Chryseobacterium contaminans]OCA80568.1 ABC transporter ATP-binding protein [Chryseobacterium contaminans]SHK82776.1 bacteriocin-processing peptidase. Cysteine peptidase. MEROPS family C39 [Chryseobacterium contaminans]
MFKKFPHFTQLEARDCGAACLQIVSKSYGKFFNLDELREICGTTKEGISVYDLCESAEAIGLKALPVKTDFRKLKNEIPLPCIAHWRGSHFIVIYKVKDDKIYVSDPALGLITYSRKEFLNGWLEKTVEKKFRQGVLIALEPTDVFNEIKPTGQSPSFVYILNYLLSHLSPYKTQSIQLIITMIVITLLQIAFPIITQSIVDIGISAKDLSFISLLLVANIILVISTSVGNWIRQSINMHIASRVKVSLLSNYISKLLKLPVSFFENKLVGDILQRSLDYERLQSFIMNSAFSIILALLNIIVFGIILFIYKPSLFFIFLLGSVLYITWTLLFWSIRQKMDIQYFSLQAKNNSHWIETLTNINEIKNNNYEKGKRWKWEKLQVKLYEVGIKLLNVNQIESLGNNLINTLKDVALTFYSAYLVIQGDITIGMLIAIQYILGQLRNPLNEVINFIKSYQTAYISFIRMNEVNQIPEEQDIDVINNVVFPRNKSLTLKNISFRYTNSSPLVINNISLTIPEGKVTAIVGESGSGKSTLLKILMRLYTQTSGEFYIGETNVSNISLKLWRDKIGVVNQDGDVFKDSIKNNIILGAEFDKDLFHKAVVSSNILRDIERLPKGFNTVMGENGRGLSQGQKQRVMIARALYKNPEYLFFDEATNALDSINEARVVKNLSDEYEGKTAIIVAHRLSTIRNADQIIVMQNGNIVEIGNHEELIKKQKYYYRIFTNQISLNSIL